MAHRRPGFRARWTALRPACGRQDHGADRASPADAKTRSNDSIWSRTALARSAMRCGASDKERNDATRQDNPASGGPNRPFGGVAALARCPTSRCAPRLAERTDLAHQSDSQLPDNALAVRCTISRCGASLRPASHKAKPPAGPAVGCSASRRAAARRCLMAGSAAPGWRAGRRGRGGRSSVASLGIPRS